MNKTVILLAVFFAFISCQQQTTVSSEELNPEWVESYPGVWKSEINKPDDFNLLSVANKIPRKETLSKKSTQKFPISSSEIKAFTKNGKT